MLFTAEEEREEASGYRRTRSRAGRRQQRSRPRRSESLEAVTITGRPHGRKRGKRASSTTADAAVPVIKTAARSRLRSNRGARIVEASVTERKRKGIRESDNYDDESGREAKKMSLGDAAMEEEEEEAQGGQEEEEQEEVSSAPSSPLCEPYIHREVIRIDSNGVEVYKPIGSETFKAYEKSDAKFNEKLDRKMKLPTLDSSFPSTCLNDPQFLHVRELASKTLVEAGKFVFGLSSSVGGEPLTQCTGFLIDRNKDGTGIILTSAHLIRTKHPSLDNWLCKDEYATDAQVVVHLPGNITENAHLLYYQKHYNIALFRSKVKLSVELPFFNDNVSCGEMVFMLGRDEKSIMRVSSGRVQCSNPNLYERYHFMYAYGAGATPKCTTGGPAIDFDGKIVGMSNATKKGSFVPTAIILKWKNLWQTYGHIPRPHLGLKLWAIKFLDAPQIENILYNCGTDDGLIVKEVSNGSLAEKVGIRVGDIIECLNGNTVSSMIQLENMLLCLSEQHLSEKNEQDSKIDVKIVIFRTRKGKRKIINMTLDVTDEGEEVHLIVLLLLEKRHLHRLATGQVSEVKKRG
ncbi:hypothetical protein EJB05_27908 [Eragrostis curvula]|uniref:PDZ domain-containing protein n=1 Tax=Eragrostis curvula TaxID=38414 RepID=A0A5J9UNT0_9POAL|nr:hypothetical protein EJB05_27908 [Eragrostis curvula]